MQTAPWVRPESALLNWHVRRWLRRALFTFELRSARGRRSRAFDGAGTPRSKALLSIDERAIEVPLRFERNNKKSFDDSHRIANGQEHGYAASEFVYAGVSEK